MRGYAQQFEALSRIGDQVAELWGAGLPLTALQRSAAEFENVGGRGQRGRQQVCSAGRSFAAAGRRSGEDRGRHPRAECGRDREAWMQMGSLCARAVVQLFIGDGDLAIRPLQDNAGDYQIMAKWLTDPRVLEFYEGRDNPFPIDRIKEKHAPRVLGEENVVPLPAGFPGRADRLRSVLPDPGGRRRLWH